MKGVKMWSFCIVTHRAEVCTHLCMVLSRSLPEMGTL